MLKYLARRLALIPVTFVLLAAVVFVILRVTADPVELFMDIHATQEQREVLFRELNLDKPLYVQFAIFLGDVMRGDFGRSHVFQAEALPLVLQRLGPTALLASTALVMAVGFGGLLGTLCAVRKDGVFDFCVSSLALAGQSMPSFWLGILLIQLFALNLGWVPTSGFGSPEHLVLPAITLAAYLMPNFILVMRTSVLETIGEQFVTTARAKGLRESIVLARHAIPNAIAPALTLLGLQLGVLIGGSIVTETIFAWPGVGRLIISSIFQRDVTVVVAGVFMISFAIIVCNLLVDVVLTLIDPRIRSADG
jgi:peptide/nickel transport system permease protein/glutathione transport system permease protein